MSRALTLRLVTAMAALIGLSLALEPMVAAKKPKAGAEPASVFLARRLAYVAEMPPCTPLLEVTATTASITELRHSLGQWQPFRLKRKRIEEAVPSMRLEECLAAATEYDGRYTSEQAEALEQRRITVGMPAEFALMLLGPPDPVDPGAVGASESYTAQTTLRWVKWGAILQVDEAGRIVRIRLELQDTPALFIEGDSETMTVSRQGAGVVAVSSHDEAQADYHHAMEAYRSGDYATTIEILRPLAEAGHAPSQYALGDMYYQGDGVEKDLGEAAYWIGQAAASRLPGALYHLGFLQLRGEGIAQDPVAAYVSMRAAAELGDPEAAKVIDTLEQKLSAEQLAEARKRIEANGFHEAVLIHAVHPVFPMLARVAHVESFVLLQARIGTDGSVSDVEVLQIENPDLGFEEAAIEAVSQWRYEPARRRDTGEPVEVYHTIFVTFDLK